VRCDATSRRRPTATVAGVHAVLLIGSPRGGTTWAGNVLARTRSAAYVHEPDGTNDPFSFRATLPLHPHPMLDPGDEAPDYERLWTGAFAGGAPSATVADRIARRAYGGVTGPEKRHARLTGRLSPRLRLAVALARPRVARTDVEHVVVKSVNTAFSAQWVADRFPVAVAVMSRHPLNVIASWHEFGWAPHGPTYRAMRARAAERWSIDLPDEDAGVLAQVCAMVGAIEYSLHRHLEANPHWIEIGHEQACIDPLGVFTDAALRLGLEWHDDATRFLAESDRPGAGFATRRVGAEQPHRWRERLGADELRTATDVLARFDGMPWLESLG
jgi:hypothetical protein